jgi:hypothetical protein
LGGSKGSKSKQVRKCNGHFVVSGFGTGGLEPSGMGIQPIISFFFFTAIVVKTEPE